MKVSLIHAERRSAQPIALDVVTPVEELGGLMLDVPERLRPTHRCEFALPRVLLCIVAAAPLKQRESSAPLLVELEAEEGETLHDDSLRVFVVDAPPAYYTVAALDAGKLVRVEAPLTRAGDRQQFAVARIEIVRERDVLLAIDNRARELAPAVLEETGQVSAPVNVGRGVCEP